MSKEHRYTNGEVTIVWNPGRCIHSTRCWKGLGEVFQPGKRPWIRPEGVATERIIAQVDQCPSGALTWRMNASEATTEQAPAPRTTIEVIADGPLLVRGDCTVHHSDGRTEERTGNTALCRCGHSANKPFCDGSHRRASFKG